jgi:hypothetical protein
MQLNLKDEPREWRKSAVLTLFGLALISSLMRWRHVLSTTSWLVALAALAALILAALFQPRWFRPYHLFSMRFGFVLSQQLGRVALILFFALVLLPVGLILRWTGHDPLQLRRRPGAPSYWQNAREPGPLDRLF